jgi:Asp-tRNA(Asn)/Glu-tRNA(Gln) amidotransferase A subunit family amidase
VLGFEDYRSHDALGLAGRVHAGELCAREVVEAAAVRADEVNQRIGAICYSDFERALDLADRVDTTAPFAGVPMLIKDLGVQAAGLPLGNGSRLFADYVPEIDDELVRRYRRAGFVVAGRTTSPEFGACYVTEPDIHPPARNPWDPARTPGGSSGGAAAAIAAGIVPLAQASDGGGSIRVPASCCGLFGLKPSRARVPVGPSRGESWGGLGVVHAITRSVRDSAALLDASAGRAPGDPYMAPPPSRPFLDEVGADPGRLRIALSLNAPNGAALDPDCRAAAEDAARLCESLGHHVEPANPPLDYAAQDQATSAIVCASARALVEERCAQLGIEPSAELVMPVTWRLAELGRDVSGARLTLATDAMHRLARGIGEWFAATGFDAVLSPVLAQPPVEVGHIDMTMSDHDAYRSRSRAFVGGFPMIANLTGGPAMSVPLAWSGSGLPIGVQFVADYGQETLLLRLAGQLEAARPWFDRIAQL